MWRTRVSDGSLGEGGWGGRRGRSAVSASFWSRHNRRLPITASWLWDHVTRLSVSLLRKIFIIYKVIPYARVITGLIPCVVLKQLLNTVFFLNNIIVLPFEYKYDIHFLFNPFHAVWRLLLNYPWKLFFFYISDKVWPRIKHVSCWLGVFS